LFFKYAPKEEQLQVVEHVAEQKDCVLLAPCGWGKTLAFFLPIVIFKHSITVIISPLIGWIEEHMQVCHSNLDVRIVNEAVRNKSSVILNF